MKAPYTKNRDGSTHKSARAFATITGRSPNRGAPPGGWIDAGEDAPLEHLSDIRLADVLAERKLLKDDPEYRRKNLPESALTPRERIRLAEQRRREKRALDLQHHAWRRRYPAGCQIDGIAYDHRFRICRVWAAPGQSLSYGVTRVVEASWPRALRIVAYRGDGEADRNYLRRGSEWVALCRYGGDGYFVH